MMSYIVSVPLSGLASVNSKFCFSFCIVGDGFRPLIGVSFCKRGTTVITLFDQYCFRPLIGVSFCKHDAMERAIKKAYYVSVPLSGLASVN